MITKRWSELYGREVWGFDARVGGKRVRKFGFSSEAAAILALSKARIEAYDRKHGVAPPPAKASAKVKDLVEKRAAQLQATPRRRVSAGILKRWCDTLPAGLLVTELATSHLQNYQDARLKDVKPQTAFRELTDICSMLNNARDFFAELEEWSPPRRPRLQAPTGTRDRIIKIEEARALLTHLRRPREEDESEGYFLVRCDAADLLEIALLTAARRGELLRLGWTDVNFSWRTLRIFGSKKGRARVIEMVPALVEILCRRQASAGASRLVFYALEGSTMLRANTDQIYRKASAELGIPYGRETPGGWILHDARHTAITAMLHAGHSLESVMAISGHSARVMAIRYAHSTERTRRAAVTALEQFAAVGVSAFSSGARTETTPTTPMSPKVKASKPRKTAGKKKKSTKPRIRRAS